MIWKEGHPDSILKGGILKIKKRDLSQAFWSRLFSINAIRYNATAEGNCNRGILYTHTPKTKQKKGSASHKFPMETKNQESAVCAFDLWVHIGGIAHVLYSTYIGHEV